MKKLGFGCMRLPLLDNNNKASVDPIAFNALIDRFISLGGTYFDTAYFYHGGASESFVKRCLVERYPRDRFQLATKLFMTELKSRQHAEDMFQEQLDRCGVEFFDYYLLHNINDENYKKAVEFKCFELQQEMKAAGKIKRAGFSFHGSAALLDTVLTAHPETEFVQLQLNYLDWEDSNVQSRLCYEVARKHGKDVIVMEPCKGGELATVPDEAMALMKAVHPDATPASWAFRYVGALEGVIMVLSGMNALEQVEENCAVLDSALSMSEEELAVIAKTVAIIDAVTPVKCTACRYCEEGCPMNIPIPDCFGLYNRYARTKVENLKNSYRFRTEGKGKASECIACGACVGKCPQNLPIPELLKDVAAALEC